MKVLVYLGLISMQMISILGQACPDSSFTYCAVENGNCDITDTIKEGFMSYGANGRWTLVPFTNSKTDGTDIVIQCDNDHGDIIYGTRKYCCYRAADTGFPTTGWAGFLWENSGGWRHFNDFESQRYGADSRYVYRVMTKTVGWCNNEFFNDPVYGTKKHCNYNHWEPATLRTASWTLCANEGYDCTGVSGSNWYWIRYGDNGSYYYRLVRSSSDGRVPCTNGFFDDPIYGVAKHCWRSAAFSISDLQEPPPPPPSDNVNVNVDTDDRYLPSKVIKSPKWYHFITYISNNPIWFFIFGAIITLLLCCNLLCLSYKNCIKLRKRKNNNNKYRAVKMVDSESDIESEVNPINIAQ